MKAAVRSTYGAPDVVRIVDVERPTIKNDELLVKVHATTVNRTDCAYRSAKPFINRLFTGLFRPKWAILGTEFAGEVTTVGSAVTSFAVGDRVFGFIEQGGCHAEFVSIPESGSLALIPSGLTYDLVAPSTEGSHYALTSIKGAKVQAGQDVLVNGGTGGIGSAAVQLLKAVGANVTAVCGPGHVDLVRGLRTSRRTLRRTTSSSIRSARARSANAGGS